MLHDGTFTEVGTKSGLTHCGWGFGVAVGDFDNDGWEDLYVTYLDGGVLYRNNHDDTFSDVTAKAGVGNPGQWGTSAAFADYDNDGHLDLYIANYVDIDLDHLPEFGSGPFCTYRGIKVSCGPRGLKGARDRLYHNNGDGTFTDVAEKLNIDPGAYYGLGVLWVDYDKDGCPDLYVANDSTPSLLYHNDCKGGFTEVGIPAGVAYSSDGREEAGMPYYSFNFVDNFLNGDVNTVIYGPTVCSSTSCAPDPTQAPTFSGPPTNPGMGIGAQATGNLTGWAPFSPNQAVLTGIVLPEGIKDPYVYNYFFGVQRELPGRVVIEANYVGNAGHKLFRAENINRHPGSALDPGLTFTDNFGRSWTGNGGFANNIYGNMTRFKCSADFGKSLKR